MLYRWIYNLCIVTHYHYTTLHYATHSQLAIKLIKDGNAYMCFQSASEIKECKDSIRNGKVVASPFRDTPVEENLRLFDLMRRGRYVCV
jgi:glutaminyl-tRNA synthetase